MKNIGNMWSKGKIIPLYTMSHETLSSCKNSKYVGAMVIEFRLFNQIPKKKKEKKEKNIKNLWKLLLQNICIKVHQIFDRG